MVHIEPRVSTITVGLTPTSSMEGLAAAGAASGDKPPRGGTELLSDESSDDDDNDEDGDRRRGTNATSRTSLSSRRASVRTAGQWRKSLFKTGVSQVFVNSELVFKKKKLNDGDRLRIGTTHTFRICIPCATVTPSRKKTIVSSMIDESFKDDHHKILAQGVASHLKERIGSVRTAEVFEHLKEIRPLVDEANDLTEELRGDERFDFVFSAQILSDPMNAEHNPEVMVALRLMEKPDDIDDNGNMLFDDEQERSMLTLSWTISKFKQRLELIRDLYAEVSERESPWGNPDDPDPWRDDPKVPLYGGKRNRITKTGVVILPDNGEEVGEPGPLIPTSPGSVQRSIPMMQAEIERMQSELSVRDSLVSKMRSARRSSAPTLLLNDGVASMAEALARLEQKDREIAGLNASIIDLQRQLADITYSRGADLSTEQRAMLGSQSARDVSETGNSVRSGSEIPPVRTRGTRGGLEDLQREVTTWREHLQGEVCRLRRELSSLDQSREEMSRAGPRKSQLVSSFGVVRPY